ncbi:hypothetical protein CCP4SC76_2140011 [Gammaproteobacteria bacterium]
MLRTLFRSKRHAACNSRLAEVVVEFFRECNYERTGAYFRVFYRGYLPGCGGGIPQHASGRQSGCAGQGRQKYVENERDGSKRGQTGSGRLQSKRG